MSSRDGYCTIVVFDEIMTSHHTQQHTLQLQSIANHNSVPLIYSSTPAATPSSTPSIPSLALPPTATPVVNTMIPTKRRTAESPSPLTPASCVDETSGGIRQSASDVSRTSAKTSGPSVEGEGPPKKKRRAALTKVSELG
jgi:chromatin assembly factor 1 subunit B